MIFQKWEKLGSQHKERRKKKKKGKGKIRPVTKRKKKGRR